MENWILREWWGRLHSLKLKFSPLQIGHPKRKFIFQPWIFRGKLAVSFRGSAIRNSYSIVNFQLQFSLLVCVICSGTWGLDWQILKQTLGINSLWQCNSTAQSDHRKQGKKKKKKQGTQTLAHEPYVMNKQDQQPHRNSRACSQIKVNEGSDFQVMQSCISLEASVHWEEHINERPEMLVFSLLAKIGMRH